ncbi:phosphohydrolase [Clostridium gelidum]|uniref:Phosphohydrolase n=1 Tax=Clostridium gelidum TaxID=704125 RepID=A0ABM7T504_9CLOT|nr:metallophosphoesterase [Clostridium gelidum]BCZ45998.1 phosphohydrolase [Clostridium gelidum]
MIKNLIAISSLTLMSTLIYFENTLIKISNYRIKSDKIPKEFNNFKIVQLSDFHSYGFEKDNAKVLKKINDEHPNIIVMTGDMVNKYDENFEKFFNLAETLSEKYEIYYILGNHEIRLRKDDLSFIIQKLKEFGIKILRDEKITIMREKDYINIYGIDIPLLYYKTINKPSNVEEVISGALNKCNKKEYNILLAHNPLYFEEYSKQNVDLTLSGHVHGGMIRLPFIGAILSPERKLFPKYSSGIYEINNKKLLVNRGLGHSRPGIRLFNKREIVSITLLSSK